MTNLCYYTPRMDENTGQDGFLPASIYEHEGATAKQNVENAVAEFERKNPEMAGKVSVGEAVLAECGLHIEPSFLPDLYHVEETDDVAEMAVTKAEFKPGKVHAKRAEEFFNLCRDAVITEFEHRYPLEDFVLVVLTGDLGKPEGEKTFDSFEMIEHVLEMEPERHVLIRLPGGVSYDDDTFAQLIAYDLHERVTFTKGNIDRLLDACAYVVTQDSPAATKAIFHRKNAITYRQMPAHHLAQKPFAEKRLIRSYNRAKRSRPEFEKYAYWLFREMCVDASGSGGKARVLKALEAANENRKLRP